MVLFGVIAIFHWVVAPGLSTDVTLVNILSAVMGFITILFVALYVKEFIFPPNKTDLSTDKDGETELDYIPKDKATKKKRNPKQFPEVKSEEKFVKTRKKKVDKSEFPLPPNETL